MLENAAELESLAVALLQQYASTNPRLTETILIRAVPVIGNRTLLHMARFAGALRIRDETRRDDTLRYERICIALAARSIAYDSC